MAATPDRTEQPRPSWGPLLLWTLVLFGLRLALAFSDGSILRGPDSAWDKGVTLRNPCLRPF